MRLPVVGSAPLPWAACVPQTCHREPACSLRDCWSAAVFQTSSPSARVIRRSVVEDVHGCRRQSRGSLVDDVLYGSSPRAWRVRHRPG
jgi:hypothetical protein